MPIYGNGATRFIVNLYGMSIIQNLIASFSEIECDGSKITLRKPREINRRLVLARSAN